LVGAGDIATCGELAGAEATAELIGRVPGTVFAVGDLAYPDGSDEQFANCYGPTWADLKNALVRLRGTTNITVAAPPDMCAISERLRAIRRRDTKAAIWARGTSSY